VQLNDLARAAADMLGYTLRSHGIAMELRLDERLPELQADGDQLGQVVLNLIVNAQQALATHAGLRRIVVASGISAAGGRVWLRIADSGPGVPEALREKIFEPFFTTKAEGIGTGIGLSVSRAIVVEHGGELALEPAVAGQGASFLMTLPQVAAPPAADEPQATDAAPPPSAASPTARVLVVDDEAEVADLVRVVLEGAGHEVATADSGEVALAMLEEARFDAIVSDLRMPGIDGAALWRQVRDRHPALARRMVFLTGDTLSPGAQQFLDETGCGRLEKPFARDDLLARVRHALQHEVDHG
jgi:CheY-like chemotaxis protein